MEPTENAAPGRTTGPRKRRVLGETAEPKISVKARVGIAACALLVLVGLGAFYWFVLADHNRHHSFPVAWPKDAPTGDPVVVRHAVKAGDVFVTTLTFRSGIILGFTSDPLDGMRLDGQLTIAQQVAAKEGGGLLSHAKVFLDKCTATYAPMKDAVWKALGDRTDPYALDYDRQPSGRPDRKSAKGAGATAARHNVLDRITSGLGDIVTIWLPDRDVRIGEAWELSTVADVHNLVPFMRQVAGSDAYPEGFPEPTVRGMGAAEAVETRDGEECLRVRIVAYVTQEGPVKEPARPGWISSAVRIDGHAWIATATGVVWALEAASDMQSSYLVKEKVEERLAKQVIEAKTVRAERMPE